jgi:hypothetical protein
MIDCLVISCPAKGCNMQVDEVTVGKLLTDPKVRDKYVQMIAQAYVEVLILTYTKTYSLSCSVVPISCIK